MNRRGFLVGAGAAVAWTEATAWSFLEPQPATRQISLDWRESLLARPRIIRMWRPASREAVNVCYWLPGSGIQRAGYDQLCWIMRDVQAGVHAKMDPRLLDLLCGIQYWLRYYGHDYLIHLLSGLRTPDTNARTEGAAKNSLHIEGMAADIRIPGLLTKTLGFMAKEFGVGGTGFYVDRGFIHVDSGRVRSW